MRRGIGTDEQRYRATEVDTDRQQCRRRNRRFGSPRFDASRADVLETANAVGVLGTETRGAALVVEVDRPAFGIASADETGPTRLVGGYVDTVDRHVDSRVAFAISSIGRVAFAGRAIDRGVLVGWRLLAALAVGTTRALVVTARTPELLPQERGETVVHTGRWTARSIGSLPPAVGFTFSACRTFYTMASQPTYVSH